MFRLTGDELKNWKSQFVTSNSEKMGLRKLPLVFTEQGVAMLSSVLNSPRAIMVNIQIIRTFTKLRELLAQDGRLRLKLEAMELRYDKQFKVVFDAIRQLLSEPPSSTDEIGFKA